MRYIVHTRQSISMITPQRPHVVVSVSTPGSEPASIQHSALCRGVLRLEFDDLDRDAQHVPILLLSGNTLRTESPTLFNADMADQILDFWLIHRGVNEFYVHCDAGQCRSPAIAAALQKIETGSDDVWFATKRPNMLVYSTLLERAFARGLIG